MQGLSEIELSITIALNSFAIKARENNFSSDRDWTYYLKESLAYLGENTYGCKICSTGFKDVFEPEWLYDLVWYKEYGDGDNARLIDVPLVAESEWNLNFHQIKLDFEKLLVANASHRLFICYVYISNREKIVNYFKDAIEHYKLGRIGDRFLIAILDYDRKDFSYELLIKN